MRTHEWCSCSPGDAVATAAACALLGRHVRDVSSRVEIQGVRAIELPRRSTADVSASESCSRRARDRAGTRRSEEPQVGLLSVRARARSGPGARARGGALARRRAREESATSPFPNSQAPYVRWQLNGKPLDVNGDVLPTKYSPDAHIPLQKFKVNPDLFQ